MKKILNFLSGKKTIVTGIVAIILGILQEDTNMIMTGLGMIFLRTGINTVGKKK